LAPRKRRGRWGSLELLHLCEKTPIQAQRGVRSTRE
jgi:hypothetical protein